MGGKNRKIWGVGGEKNLVFKTARKNKEKILVKKGKISELKPLHKKK